MTAKRKKELKIAADAYANKALKSGTAAASREFFNDYINGKWTCSEHLLLMLLVQQYIYCKNGFLSKAECRATQNKIFKQWERTLEGEDI